MWALVALVVFTSYTLVINILLCLFISNIFYIYSMKKMVQTLWVLQGITFFYVMCLSYVLVIQSCLTLCDPMDCCPPGSSVYGILQAWILKWVAISSSRGFSPPRDWTQGLLSCRPILYHLSYQGSPHTLWVYEGASLLPLLGQPCLHL